MVVVKQFVKVIPTIVSRVPAKQVWPDHNPFGIKILTTESNYLTSKPYETGADNTHLWFLEGEQDKIDAFCLAYKGMVTKLTSTDALNLGKNLQPARTVKCGNCGASMNIPEFTLPT